MSADSNEGKHSQPSGISNSDKPESKDTEETSRETYGYEFYPERFGRKTKSLTERVLTGRESGRNLACVSNVYWCIRNNVTVQILLGALKSHGCKFNVSRHVSCEECKSRVNGGFDPSQNQIVVCQNNSNSKPKCCKVLSHELVHMFDSCRADVDFKDPEHLACSEIRAANLMHCSYLSAWLAGTASPINIREQHKECVRNKALMSVLMVREISREDAGRVVDRVFDRCYNDLEPLGRRPTSDRQGMEKARSEAYLYGYTDWTEKDM